jgi:4-diphosphocytidyl-2-C-methyl-D-erythritol kinase
MKTEFAPAKINLALHVTGRRGDGYHLLDSLVVFAGIGDRVTVTPADALSLTVAGAQAAQLPVADDNLVLRAARAFGSAQGARITLDKVLPITSGIGGGSADAAATLRLLARVWGVALPDAAAVLALGADVPVCLAGRPARMTGVGDQLSALPHALPAAWVVLVNPGVAVPTPAVFSALQQKENPAIAMPLPRWLDATAMARDLAQLRNDLEPPAIQIAPVIGTAKAALAATGDCLLARMSGSGATCFGLYADEPAATAAAQLLSAAHPKWWVVAAPLLN